MCSVCKIEKIIKSFYSNKARSTGVYSQCIECYKSTLTYPKSDSTTILYKRNELKIEEWLPVSINGDIFPYHISDCGRLKLKSGKMGKYSFDQRGYPQIVLSLKGKRIGRRIHILVAEHFIGNHLKLREVNHKNGNKLYPHKSNLEYVSSKDNTKHAFKTGLRNNSK